MSSGGEGALSVPMRLRLAFGASVGGAHQMKGGGWVGAQNDGGGGGGGGGGGIHANIIGSLFPVSVDEIRELLCFVLSRPVAELERVELARIILPLPEDRKELPQSEALDGLRESEACDSRRR